MFAFNMEHVMRLPLAVWGLTEQTASTNKPGQPYVTWQNVASNVRDGRISVYLVKTTIKTTT